MMVIGISFFLSLTEIVILATFNLSSANELKFIQFIILYFDKELLVIVNCILIALHHIHLTYYFLLNDKILDMTKLKAFADDKINVAKMMISVVNRVEHYEKRRKMLVTSIFSFSPQCFQRASFLGSLKVWIVW